MDALVERGGVGGCLMGEVMRLEARPAQAMTASITGHVIVNIARRNTTWTK
jgi:hypothetical protein